MPDTVLALLAVLALLLVTGSAINREKFWGGLYAGVFLIAIVVLALVYPK